jgi:hypothetical protein
MHGRGSVLGVPETTWPTHGMTLEPGSSLLLYTDGLIERRDEDIDLGIERLVGACGGLDHDFGQATTDLLAVLPPGQELTDDVAVMLVGRHPG